MVWYWLLSHGLNIPESILKVSFLKEITPLTGKRKELADALAWIHWLLLQWQFSSRVYQLQGSDSSSLPNGVPSASLGSMHIFSYVPILLTSGQSEGYVTPCLLLFTTIMIINNLLRIIKHFIICDSPWSFLLDYLLVDIYGNKSFYLITTF